MEDQEIIGIILGSGVKTVIESEPVLDPQNLGLTRPLVTHYVAFEGTVVETIEYAEPPQSRAWGAIKSINYALLEETEYEVIDL
jgi:hypothetical protein